MLPRLPKTLVNMTRRYLPIESTQVPLERYFSMYGDVPELSNENYMKRYFQIIFLCMILYQTKWSFITSYNDSLHFFFMLHQLVAELRFYLSGVITF
jgi:hypothetical protein